jgi:DNA repair exonuclease SbcCD ATPase subunit
MIRGIEWPPPSLEERPDSATGRAASMCETCGGADVMEATREERNGLRASISVLEAHLARAQAERDAALKRTEGWRAEFEHARTDLAAALKREGEARRELEAVEGQRDAAIAGADVIARAAREARERAIEECAKVVEEFADETDSDPERLAVLSAALAVRALAPVPTAPPTHPNDCVCPFPRMLCPACHNPCRACRYARVPTAEDDKETTT